MKIVVQRVLEASVEIDGSIAGAIDQGLVLFVGFCKKDNEMVLNKMIDKLINLRIFEDEKGMLNLSLLDVNGSILSISQFTLYANCKKGRRPSFDEAASFELAAPLYKRFNELLADRKINIQTGVFGATMKISLINNGPITIILDSNQL